jgi:protein TonB
MKGYIGSHLSYIKEMIQKNITYPDIARRNGWTGKVKISFIIAYNGYAKNIKVMQSSGFKILDKNATEAVKHSSPFPEPPVEARIIIPILYELN